MKYVEIKDQVSLETLLSESIHLAQALGSGLATAESLEGAQAFWSVASALERNLRAISEVLI